MEDILISTAEQCLALYQNLYGRKKYPVNDKNQLANVTDPMFFQYLGKNYLIDSGLGNRRLTEKQKRNYGVTEESFVLEDLAQLSIAPEEH